MIVDNNVEWNYENLIYFVIYIFYFFSKEHLVHSQDSQVHKCISECLIFDIQVVYIRAWSIEEYHLYKNVEWI